jgi:hypothetical protein
MQVLSGIDYLLICYQFAPPVGEVCPPVGVNPGAATEAEIVMLIARMLKSGHISLSPNDKAGTGH